MYTSHLPIGWRVVHAIYTYFFLSPVSQQLTLYRDSSRSTSFMIYKCTQLTNQWIWKFFGIFSPSQPRSLDSVDSSSGQSARPSVKVWIKRRKKKTKKPCNNLSTLYYTMTKINKLHRPSESGKKVSEYITVNLLSMFLCNFFFMQEKQF